MLISAFASLIVLGEAGDYGALPLDTILLRKRLICADLLIGLPDKSDRTLSLVASFYSYGSEAAA
jgi:hypothetical protein